MRGLGYATVLASALQSGCMSTTDMMGLIREKCKMSESVEAYHINRDMELACAKDGSFIILGWSDDEWAEISSIEPTQVNRQELLLHIRDKHIVIFGDVHNVSDDDRRLASLMPNLADFGFTHFGLELDARFQDSIDAYANDPTAENRQRLLEMLTAATIPSVDVDSYVSVIEAAIGKDMAVIAIDKEITDLAASVSRERFMKGEIDKIIANGGKVAVFVGAAHASFRKRFLSVFGRHIPETTVDSLPEGTTVYVIPMTKPLGRLLLEEYGPERVGLIGLTFCDHTYTVVCFDD